MKTQKLAIATLAIAALIASYLVYQSKIAFSPEKDSEKAPTITVTYLPSDHHAALFVAAENQELFKEKGIYLKSIVDKERYELYTGNEKIANLRIVLAKKGGAEAMTLMEQGHSDINLNGAPPTIFFIDKGTKAKIVSPLQEEGSAIVVRKDNPSENWSEFISWIKSDEGQEKIGFPLITSIQKVMLESALKASGISYSENPGEKTDVLIIDMKGQGTMLTSLERGDLDAVIAWQPTPAIIAGKGIGKIIAYSQDLPPEGMWQNHVCCVIAASDKMIKEKREILKNFLKLMMISTNAINKNPNLAIRASAKWLGVDEEVEKMAIPNIKFSMETNEEWFNGNYTFVKEMDNLGKLEGKLKGIENSEEIKNILFDFSVYEKAKKELGIMTAGKHYDSNSLFVKYSINDVIEKAKGKNYSVRCGSAHSGPYEYFNWNEKSPHILYAYKEDYISIRISDDAYWFTIDPADITDPSNRKIRIKFVPLKDTLLSDAKTIVTQELKNINILIKEELNWDIGKGYQPPELTTK